MPRSIPVPAVFISLVLLAGCGGSDEEQIRSVFEDFREAAGSRDYSIMWEHMDSGSRSALSKQLSDLQGAKPGTVEYAAASGVLRGMGLTVEQVQGMGTAEYFVAVLEGSDRVQPEVRKQQIEDTKTRQIIKLEVLGDTAEMVTKTASGLEERFSWVRESSGWKITATSVGKGLERGQ